MRSLVSLVFILLCSATIIAQPRYDFGVQGGVLISGMPGFSNVPLSKVSGYGGIALTRRDDKKNYLQLDIGYIRKGAFRLPDNDTADRFNLSLHYAEAALVYRWEVLKISRGTRGGLDAGMSYAYLLSPQIRRNGDRFDFNPIWSDKYDLSIIAGAHMIFNGHVLFRTRITYSVNPILRRNFLPNDIEHLSVLKTHNITLQFGVVWLMRGMFY
jgi:hypothetical protein